MQARFDRAACTCGLSEPGDTAAVVFAAYGSARPGAARAILAAHRSVERAVDPRACELAYTSAPVIRALERRGEPAPVLENVLGRACAASSGRIAVQPGFLTSGWALFDLTERVRAVCGERALVGKPLLACESDVDALAVALDERHPRRAGTAILFVAHGESWPQGMCPRAVPQGFDALAALRAALVRLGRADTLVLTMADAPVAAETAQCFDAERVRIVPLMLTAGHHVEHQLFGADAGSFASRLAAAGLEVERCDEGLFALPVVQELFAAHARELCQN